MLITIAIIFFVLSVSGMAILAYRKGSEVAMFVPNPDPEPSTIINLKNKLGSKLIPSELFWQKFLSKIRILVLKTDNKTSEWMRRLREKSVQNKTKFAENYWEKLKK
jgi:hypothetical protein